VPPLYPTDRHRTLTDEAEAQVIKWY